MKVVDLRNEKNNIIDTVKNTLNRHSDKIEEVSDIVLEILEDIKKNKDEAIKKYSEKFDNVKLDSFLVTKEEIDKAYKNIDKEFIEIIKESKANIEKYHSKQKYSHFDIKEENKRLTQIITPLERVGLYVPGGKSPYPSTVLMNAIPAIIAGVPEIAIATPPMKDGSVNKYILACAKICGISEIYKLGGAVAIGALAYGSQSIKPVYKICGPGNLFVTNAKKQVYGHVDIDMLAGPSEILIIATEDSDPKFIAADLLSQAEHDESAACILVTTSEKLKDEVINELEKQLKSLSKEDIARKSIDNYGMIFLVDNLIDAFDVSNEIAPEHLEIMLDNPYEHLKKVKNAGSVFLGSYTPEPVGDYFAGSNHTIPTSGKAKFYSPLSVYDFLKRTSVIEYNKEELFLHKDKIIKFADKEGLTAHSNAIKVRFSNE